MNLSTLYSVSVTGYKIRLYIIAVIDSMFDFHYSEGDFVGQINTIYLS
jgi:hypothetical protein